MPDIYKRVNGYKFEKFIALMDGPQEVAEAHAREAATKAKAILAEHRDTGDSKITVEHGKVDWHVILNDEAGQKAAIAIEFGTKRSEGIYALHRAFALATPGRGKRFAKRRKKRR